MRLPLGLGLIVWAILALSAAAEPPPAPQAPFQAGVKNFVLTLAYSGPQDKPFYAMTLSVKPIDRAAATPFQQDAIITEQEAGKLIDVLTTIGFFQESYDANVKTDVIREDGYTLTVSAGEGAKLVCRIDPLGFDLRMLGQMDELRKVLVGDTAKAMDQVLGRLSGLRKAWTDEGRVFARRGLVMLVKNPAPVATAQAVVFDVTLRNESNAVIGLPQSYSDNYRWPIAIHGPGSVLYTVWRPARRALIPPMIAIVLEAGKSVDFKVSLANCTFFLMPRTRPDQVAVNTIPNGKYTVDLSTHITVDVMRRDPAHPLWTGWIVAAPLTVEINGP